MTTCAGGTQGCPVRPSRMVGPLHLHSSRFGCSDAPHVATILSRMRLPAGCHSGRRAGKLAAGRLTGLVMCVQAFPQSGGSQRGVAGALSTQRGACPARWRTAGWQARPERSAAATWRSGARQKVTGQLLQRVLWRMTSADIAARTSCT